MTRIKHFFQGFTLQHVDYATRNHSKYYHAGGTVGTILLLSAPLAFAFAIGIAFGMWVSL